MALGNRHPAVAAHAPEPARRWLGHCAHMHHRAVAVRAGDVADRRRLGGLVGRCACDRVSGCRPMVIIWLAIDMRWRRIQRTTDNDS